MSKYISRLAKIGIAKEASRGAGAAPVYHLPETKFSFDDKVTKARSVGSLGKLADSEEAFVTTKYGQGDIEGEIRASSFGILLYAMLGGYSVAGPSDEAYTHDFSITQNNQHQSLSFVIEDPNTNELYKLVMLDSLEITAELDQVVQYVASFMSKCARDTGLTVPAVIAEAKFTKKHLNARFAANIAGLSAASPVSLKSLSLKISKNVVLDDVLGTAEPEDILNQQLAVEGELTLNYEAETFKNYMKDGTYRSMEIAMVNTDQVIGSGSTRPSLTFQFPKVDFFDWEPEYKLDEITTQKVSFKASYDVANALDIISLARLVNNVTSY